MHVPRILIIYGTSYGQTEKIARVIGGELQHHAFNVTLFDANRLPRDIRPDAYDGIVIGAWKPTVSASIAGAINFTRYSVFLRWYMKLASRLNGGSTDTSRDHEYTDWVQVDQFADKFAAVVSRTPTARLTGVPV